ncbi:unnamed protein product [Prunus armeniaca]|uniref:Protein kinase domain-containing protein n=1 Tax=Prunus armeniaca TaxID=36596 RepID=A0A6J5UD59_PRUAR|nr:unnamed protein product [Prunus armeniaca]
MGRKRSVLEYKNLKIHGQVSLGLILICLAQVSLGATSPTDVAAINNLHAALGTPVLPGWTSAGGDPCGETWQGVQCNDSVILGIVLNGANLGGQLGENLGMFASIQAIDLSNNHIGGSIPSNLPVSLRNFFLSANQFTGSIPDSLASLAELTDMSLNNNLLTGEIPDSFQSITGLINLDLSSNNLSGQLPPSLKSLVSLTTLHLQNNQLSGTLDVLQDLPLKKMGIHSILLLLQSLHPHLSRLHPPPPQSFWGPPTGKPPGRTPGRTPGKQADGPSSQDTSNSGKSKKFLTTKRVVGISIGGVLLFVILVLAILFFMPRRGRREEADRISKRHQIVPKEAVVRPKEDNETETRRTWAIPKPNDEQDRNVQRTGTVTRQESDLSALDMYLTPPPPPPPPPPSSTTTCMLGSVYRAQLPNGKLLAVKKLDKRASSQQKDDEFLELVNNIDRIRHANVVELIGYCAEHGQRLLIYEYCSNGSLHDTLHVDDEFKKKLPWNARIRMALGAARALEYLHEVCQPPIVHRNFKSANLLLDDDLSVRVSDCGLAPLISSGSVSQLSGHLLSAYGYGAPEFESGIYTHQSDVYSFGVVMLELLTGRKSHDSTRNRGEQFLVRWATTQLHDIDALSRMVDPSLNGQYPTKSLSHFADIISRCVQVSNAIFDISEPEFRPLMSEVVQDLLEMIRREPQGSGSSED